MFHLKPIPRAIRLALATSAASTAVSQRRRIAGNLSAAASAGV